MSFISKYNFDNWNNNNEIHKHDDITSNILFSNIDNKKYDVTFVIPSYRREDTIVETIKSIYGQNTKYRYKLYVVDDSGEYDAVVNAVKAITNECNDLVLYKNSVNLGQAANWNRCLELVDTKWMVMIHDDDMLCPDYLEKALNVANNNNCSEVGVFQSKLVNGDFGIKSEEFNNQQSLAQRILSIIRNKKAFKVEKKDIFQFILPSAGCWLLDRDDFVRRGGFNSYFGATLDGVMHFSNIMYGRGPVMIIPEFLMIRRVEKNTFLNKDIQINVIDMLYHFGMYILKDYAGLKKKVYKYRLNISTIYLAYGIKNKYLGTYNVEELMADFGIDKRISYLPEKIVSLINKIMLIKLIFRKKYV
jgi:GT2 family glycosyltransferase